MVHIPTAFKQSNFWNVFFQYTYARGYTRIPILLTIPLVYKWNMEPFVEKQFKAWNKGYTQEEVWMGVEKRTKERLAAAQE
jgi:hypothetical protein